MPFKLGLNKKISFCILMLTKMRSYTSDHVRSQYLSSTYKLVSLLAKPLSYWPLDSYKNYFMFFLWPFCFPSLLCPLNHRIVTNQYWIPSKYHHLPQGRLYHLFNLARSWGLYHCSSFELLGHHYLYQNFVMLSIWFRLLCITKIWIIKQSRLTD